MECISDIYFLPRPSLNEFFTFILEGGSLDMYFILYFYIFGGSPYYKAYKSVTNVMLFKIDLFS